MAHVSDDTIAAIATARGGAARGMVRVSGPDVGEIVGRCFVADGGVSINDDAAFCPTAISGSVGAQLGDENTRQLPCELFLWPNQRSYTREPVAEFHTFGSDPLVRGVLESVCRAGARLAEPGEFTLRAFLSGRIDLSQAEAVLGVIDARHSAQLDTALEQLAGGLAQPLHAMREELLQLLAEVEAGLDFVDEDIEFVSPEEMTRRLTVVRGGVSRLVEQMGSRHTRSGDCRVALVGAPNAGKSSLFNALVLRHGLNRTAEQSGPAAIVSSLRHTTRDYLTARLAIGDFHCELVDTAGVEDEPPWRTPSEDFVLDAAQSGAVNLRARADVRLLCVDGAAPDAVDKMAMVPDATAVDLVVLTKSDLAPDINRNAELVNVNGAAVITSSTTGEGLDKICQRLASLLADVSAESQCGVVAATADRCRDSLRLAENAVLQAIELTSEGLGDELVAGELRLALAELGKVVGAVYTDDLLDRIFTTFCIGK